MLQVSFECRPQSTKSAGNLLPGTEGNFRRVARALWPRKTAAHLAAAARVSERTATNWLAGVHEPSARAIAAIVNEMLA